MIEITDRGVFGAMLEEAFEFLDENKGKNDKAAAEKAAKLINEITDKAAELIDEACEKAQAGLDFSVTLPKRYYRAIEGLDEFCKSCSC